MAMFSAWVALRVKATFSGFFRWYSSARAQRQSKAVSAARTAAGYPPRPGELMVAMASAMAAGTVPGFWKLVAALSK